MENNENIILKLIKDKSSFPITSDSQRPIPVAQRLLEGCHGDKVNEPWTKTSRESVRALRFQSGPYYRFSRHFCLNSEDGYLQR